MGLKFKTLKTSISHDDLHCPVAGTTNEVLGSIPSQVNVENIFFDIVSDLDDSGTDFCNTNALVSLGK